MRDLLSWNVNLGRWRWAGVQIRLHVFFVAFAVLAIFLLGRDGSPVGWFAPALIAVVFFSVLLHELGHCYAARKVGGRADQIVLWPLGGLVFPHVRHDPQIELITALAGPVVNLFLCLLMMPCLIFARVPLSEIINPLLPPSGAAGLSVAEVAKLIFWTNWMLFLVNLLPASALDGSRIARALLWPHKGYRSAVLHVARGAKFAAVGLWITAWLVRDSYEFAWVGLTLLGVFLFFGAKQDTERLQDQDGDDGLFGYDFSQGYTSLERHLEVEYKPQPGPLRRWFEQRRVLRLQRRRQQEEEEDRRVDDILARLHSMGMKGLSAEERALLHRVSERYRNRQQQ